MDLGLLSGSNSIYVLLYTSQTKYTKKIQSSMWGLNSATI